MIFTAVLQTSTVLSGAAVLWLITHPHPKKQQHDIDSFFLKATCLFLKMSTRDKQGFTYHNPLFDNPGNLFLASNLVQLPAFHSHTICNFSN